MYKFTVFIAAFFSLFFQSVIAAPIQQGFRGNVTLYIKSDSEEVNGKTLYTLTKDVGFNEIYIGDYVTPGATFYIELLVLMVFTFLILIKRVVKSNFLVMITYMLFMLLINQLILLVNMLSKLVIQICHQRTPTKLVSTVVSIGLSCKLMEFN